MYSLLHPWCCATVKNYFLDACTWQVGATPHLADLDTELTNVFTNSVLFTSSSSKIKIGCTNPFWWSGSMEGAISQFSAAVIARVIKILSIYSTQEGIISGACWISPPYSLSHKTGNIYQSHTSLVSTANCTGAKPFPSGKVFLNQRFVQFHRISCKKFCACASVFAALFQIALWTKRTSFSWSHFIQLWCVCFGLCPKSTCFLVAYVVGLHIRVIYGFVPLKVVECLFEASNK